MRKCNIGDIRLGLTRGINIVTRPIVADMGIFLLLLAIFTLYSCSYYANCSASMDLSREMHRVLKLLPIHVLVSYMYVLVIYWAGLWQRWLHNVVGAIILVAQLMMTFVEVGVMNFFTSNFNTTSIMLLLQTTPDEVESFFNSYILTSRFFGFAICVLAGSAVVVTLYCLAKRYMHRYLAVFVQFIFVVSAIYVTVECAKSLFRGEWRRDKPPYTSAARFANCYAVCLRNNLRDVNDDSGITSKSENAPTIVMIVGESYNKHHASIYGYDKPTTPRQETMRDSGNLYVFTDVITPYNFTNLIVREAFSMHSFDMGEESWYDYPLVPHIMRDGGYYVSFISNQVSICGQDGWAADKTGIYFFNIPTISNRSFDYRNKHLYTYDDGLLAELDLICNKEPIEREFTILQMKGQHNHVAKYVPGNYIVFTPSDYTRKPHQSDKHVHYVATYDNATHYNDWVFGEICNKYSDREAVVIYLSDHGEEVYDYRDYLGRSGAALQDDNVLHHQYQIPFVVYVSDKYKAAYPDVVKRIEGAVNRPFSSDNIGHMIIGLSGVKTKWYDKTRDLLHDEYDTQRPRRINTGQIYTKID